VNPNIIFQVICVATFGFGIGGALVGDVYLTALGLMSALACVVILTTRDE
jgi:hypothetical protein